MLVKAVAVAEPRAICFTTVGWAVVVQFGVTLSSPIHACYLAHIQASAKGECPVSRSSCLEQEHIAECRHTCWVRTTKTYRQCDAECLRPVCGTASGWAVARYSEMTGEIRHTVYCPTIAGPFFYSDTFV
jgi:hypothetical protein